MAKVVLNDVQSLANTLSAKNVLNGNFDALTAALNNTLSRDGSTPNQMEADIDLNSYDLLNVNAIDVQQLLKNGVPYEQLVSYGTVVYQLESGDGTTDEFQLNYAPGSLGNIEVSINGVEQRPSVDFNYTDLTLSFASPPPVGDRNILIRYAKALQLGSTNAADSKFIQTGVGAKERDMQDKGREALSLTDFDGVFANGVGNDATAFRKADAEAFIRGVPLRIPAGNYLIDETITDLKSSWIADPGAVITAGPNVVLNGPGWLEWIDTTNIEISGIIFDFQSRPCTIGSEAVIGFRNPDSLTLKKLFVLNLTGTGIAMNGARDVLVEQCYVSRATWSNSYNQALLVSSSSRQSTDVVIRACRFNGSALDLSCVRGTVRDCYIRDWGFGAGVTTEQDVANSGYYLIDNNQIDTSHGIDVNLTVPMGIENWGPDSVISNNVIFGCAGSGIDQGGQNTLVYGNTCFNNGQHTPSAGIVTRYGNATFNGNGSVYWANKCFDTQGSKTQTYGYSDQSASLTYLTIKGNDFNGNHLTGPENILAATVDYSGPTFNKFFAWDPPSVANGAATPPQDFVFGGAQLGDFVTASFVADLNGCALFGYAKAANTVSVTLLNLTGGVKDLGSSSVRIKVEKPMNYAAF